MARFEAQISLTSIVPGADSSLQNRPFPSHQYVRVFLDIPFFLFLGPPDLLPNPSEWGNPSVAQFTR